MNIYEEQEIWKNIPELGNFNAPKLARQVVFEINLTDCVT